jgi:HK97 family phage major capsid protein
MHKVTELLQKRAALNEDVRKLHKSAEGRLLTADELKKVDELEKDMDSLRSNADAIERQEKRDAELATVNANRVAGSEQTDESRSKKTIESFRNYLITGERRDLAADTASAGGNIVAPQQFVNSLLTKLNDLVFLRQFATKYTLGSFANLGVPTLTADPADADWTTEVAAVTNDTAMTFGKRTMAPNLLTKGIKVSMKLLEVGTLPAEQIVSDRLAYKFAISEEKAFLTGDGSGKPLGLFTASASGVSTGRDYATGNSTTAIVADNLYGQVYNVKGQYRKNGKWLFHRDAISMVRKLKDSANQYLWQPSVAAGQPDTLLGYQVLESEYVPNTFTTGLYVGLFGDLSYYWIVDQLPYTVQRLVELYAGTNQVGFIGRRSIDGAPVDETAFSRVKLG